MSEAQNTNTQPAAASELESLKKRADLMGITYAANIGVESLREKVNAAVTAAQQAEEAKTPASAAAAPAEDVETEYQKQYREHMRLVRCRIVNLNPQKANVPGEVITFANGVLGKVSKMIPFGDAGLSYHVPAVLLEVLRSKKFVQMKSVKKGPGTHVIERRLVPEYAIEVLPDLTKEELEDLKARQHASGAIEN